MGRKRTRDKHLPANMQRKHGAYYFVKAGKWNPLAKDYPSALVKYAALIGAPPKVRTVKDAVWHYIEASTGRLADKTLAGYRISAANVCTVFGGMALEDVTAADVYRYLTEKGNVQANRDRALLSAAYSEARRIGAFPKASDDPTKGLEYRNPEKPRTRYVTDAELDAIIAAASPKLGCIARFIELTGMRQGDALGVKLADLDDDGFTYWNSKGKKWQGLEWSPELTATVEDAKRLWRRFGREWLFESNPKGKHKERGIGPYTPSGLRALWRVARTKAGLTDVRLHDLRAKAGSDVGSNEDAQRLLGHADGKVTRRHYRRKVERSKPVR
jgi:integrase